MDISPLVNKLHGLDYEDSAVTCHCRTRRLGFNEGIPSNPRGAVAVNKRKTR
jgi:hypothetical protein